MRRFVELLARAVRAHPIRVIAVLVAVTVVFAALLPQLEMTQGNEGFSPDNRELTALERIGDEFATTSETVVQVVFTAEDGDVLSPAGFAAAQAVQQAAVSAVGEYLSARQDRPPFISFASPIALASQTPDGDAGTPPATDEEFDALYTRALDELPEEQAQLFSTLVASAVDLDEPDADAGLMLLFLDTAELETEAFDVEAVAEVQRELFDAIADVDLPPGIEAQPFAFELLFTDDGSFQDEVGRLFGMAFLIILVILGFVYWVRPSAGPRMTVWHGLRRTAADVVLTLATIVLSILWMQAAGVAMGPDFLGIIGKFSPPTQILPILLIGLGVDYAIHLTSRYREEVGGGATPGEAALRASRTVGVALILATFTTALGFLTNISNPLPAIQDFGMLAAVGIVFAFLLMLTLVPAVRLLLDRRAHDGDRLPTEAMQSTSERALPELMARTSVLATRFRTQTIVVTVAAGLLGLYGLSQVSTEFSFTDFVPQDDPSLEALEIIQERFGGGFGEETNVLVAEGDVATPDGHNALVASLDRLSEVDGVVTFAGRAAAESVVSVLASQVFPPQAGPNGPDPSAPPANPELAEFSFGNGLQPDLTVADDADVAAIYARLMEAAPEQAGRLLTTVDGRYIANVDVQTQAGETEAIRLRDDVAAAFSPLTEVGLEVTPTSQNIVGAVITRELQQSQALSLVITLVAATLLLAVTFWVQVRRPFLGVITMGPVVLVVLWTFGMMAATGIPFGPITAILSALAIGIGVPFTIHITHRFDEDRARFDDPADAIASTVRHTGGALAGSALTTMAGFGALTTSSLKPFQEMGLVTVYAIGFALVASVLVLPSFLMIWDDWHRKRGDEPVHFEPDEHDVSTTPAPDRA